MATLKKKARKRLLGSAIQAPTKATKKRPTTKRPTTKRPATKRPATKRPSLGRATGAAFRDRIEQVIADIAERVARIDTEYYEIGQAMLALDKPEVWRDTYHLKSFRAFIQDHVMPYTTARRMLVVASTYTKAIAKQIGLSRGFELVRYAEATKRNARQLWARNAPLGKAKIPVRQLSAAKIAALTQGAELQKRKKPRPKPSPAMERSKRAYKTSFDYDTEVHIDVENEEVLVKIALADFLAHY